jgi:hypothetical protein
MERLESGYGASGNLDDIHTYECDITSPDSVQAAFNSLACCLNLLPMLDPRPPVEKLGPVVSGFVARVPTQAATVGVDTDDHFRKRSTSPQRRTA